MECKFTIGEKVLIKNGNYSGCIGEIVAINEYSINCYSVLLDDDTSVLKSEDELEVDKTYEKNI